MYSKDFPVWGSSCAFGLTRSLGLYSLWFNRRILGGKVASRGKTWTEKIVVKRQRETNQLTGSYQTNGPRA